jgi:uronate dehydrogenase
VGPDDPVRPDTYYGTSKVFGEALTRLYVDKLGMEAVCLRIVGFEEEPIAAAYLWGWLSPRDAIHLFERSVLAEPISFLTVYGVSNNTRRRVSDQGWDVLGYRPLDDAETFADRFKDQATPFTLHGIDFALSGLPPADDSMR